MNRAASIRFGLVLFDLDGTLCRSEEDIILAWRETLDTLGLSCPRFRSLFRVGPSLQEMTDILFPGISRERKEEIIREFKFRYDNSPFPGTVSYEWADAMLAALKHAGRKLAVVTNKRQGPTRFLLKKFGWETQFDGSFSPDILPGKTLTKPELVSCALKQFDIAPEHIIMVGDTPGDIAAARKNRIPAAAVTWGYGSREELKQARPDLLLTPATWRKLLQ